MPRDSRSEFALLGLLANSSKSGYDIKKEVEDELCHFWSESVGNIYPTLNRLFDKGYVTRIKEAQERRPDRYVYTITPDGMNAFQTWLRSPVVPARPRNELLLRVFFGEHGDPNDLIDLIRGYQQSNAAALSQLRHIMRLVDDEHASDPNKLYFDLTLALGQRVFEALIAWCDHSTGMLENFSKDSSTRGVLHQT